MEVINEDNILAKQEANNKRKELKLYKLLLFKVKPNENKTKINQEYKKPKRKNSIPGVGVGVFLIDSLRNRLLIGKRRESGHYGLPGGWLELGEEWEDCASRELLEETGLNKPKDTFHHIHTLNCKKLEYNFHSISCIMMNEVQEYEFDSIYNKEPNKCYGWFWTNVKNMRRNIDKLFHPLQDFLNKFPQIKSTIDIKNMVKFSGTLSDSISGSRSNSISVTVSEGSDLISQNITEEMN
jgi:8-oxo-dGTP diphosphatase